jgi:hypothetical protein
VKTDHGQVTLNALKFKKVTNADEIAFHQKKIELARLRRIQIKSSTPLHQIYNAL